MGAGAGAQKITTDVTGNDTAGMVAGMVASGMTAKGLNGIEAEANKLAKAPPCSKVFLQRMCKYNF